MIRPSWTDTTAALARRAELAEAAAERMQDAQANFGHSERENRELFALVALSRVRDAALLKAAGSALRRRAAGRPAPLWLPPSWVLPGEAAPRWWREIVTRSDAGIWRAIPQPGPETALGQLDDPLVQDVAKGARLLQTSLVGHKGRDSSYEAYVPEGGPLQGQGVPPVPGLSPERSWKANLLLGRGGGFRVKADRMDEFQQASQDRHAVWERARSYGAAVEILLRAVT